MNCSFPPLLSLSVERQLYPKMRFLQETMGLSLSRKRNVDDDHDDDDDHAASIHTTNDEATAHLLRSVVNDAPHYFGTRLERTVAPRHAFLVYCNTKYHTKFPTGRDLFTLRRKHNSSSNNNNATTLWHDFLIACRTTKRFVALCHQWKRLVAANQASQTTAPVVPPPPPITSKQVEAFDFLFARGLMAGARDELVQGNNTEAAWNPLEYCDIDSAELIQLLVQHGANPLERDHRGATLLHWAAGTGNLAAFHALQPYFEQASERKTKTQPNQESSSGVVLSAAATAITTRDGATPLHWAAAGTTAREFGVGGHVDVCRHLLAILVSPTSRYDPQHQARQRQQQEAYVNQVTFDGNSALMWASWSGTFETVKLLVDEVNANLSITNRNGCTVAHWAASGGNLQVCQYLHERGVDFSLPNHGGNTPLTHAVAFGRASVVEWLLSLPLRPEGESEQNGRVNGSGSDDKIALQLAQNFVQWTSGQDERRASVLKAFREWYQEDESVFNQENTEEDQDDESYYMSR